MGLFEFFAEKQRPWYEVDAYTGETPPCPNCGTPLVKRFVYSGMYCSECNYGLEDDTDVNETDEALSVDEAAQIWASNGKDEDYMFGYSWEELEAAL